VRIRRWPNTHVANEKCNCNTKTIVGGPREKTVPELKNLEGGSGIIAMIPLPLHSNNPVPLILWGVMGHLSHCLGHPGAVLISLTVRRRLRKSLCSPRTRLVTSREMREAVTFRALRPLAADEHKENGSRRYLRALLPLLVRSTVKRSPKQEQGYASQWQMCCDKAAHQACEMPLCLQRSASPVTCPLLRIWASCENPAGSPMLNL
jgi:hypothetical protein